MHHIQQGPRGAGMEVRCAGGETTQDGPLDFADVIEISIDGRLAKIGSRFAVAGRRTRGRIYLAYRDAWQIADIQAAHIGGSVGRTWITSADVQRRWEGMIAEVWSIVTGSAGSWQSRNSARHQATCRYVVVDARHPGDINRLRIENRFTARYGAPPATLAWGLKGGRSS